MSPRVVAAEYECRVCTGTTTVIVEPIERPAPTRSGSEFILDAEGEHRIAKHRCKTCNQQRPHVIDFTATAGKIVGQTDEPVGDGSGRDIASSGEKIVESVDETGIQR